VKEDVLQSTRQLQTALPTLFRALTLRTAIPEEGVIFLMNGPYVLLKLQYQYLIILVQDTSCLWNNAAVVSLY